MCSVFCISGRDQCALCFVSVVGDRCVNAFPDDKCKNWRDLGDCVANKAWMTQNCKQACGTCGEGTPGSKVLVYLLHQKPCYDFPSLFSFRNSL